jgi:hypothetical protein
MTAHGRSETKAVGNSKFTDLNMTRYPKAIDSRDASNAGYNFNMQGFWDAGDAKLPAGTDPDFVLAEHVNALGDAIMAIQRVLGIEPYIDYKGADKGTVSARITAAEDKDSYYDKRYGGQNWTTTLGQTILTHTHGGGVNEAPQIDLTSDIKGKLAKTNVDLTQATGITGSDLILSVKDATKIADAIADKLSMRVGGTIQADLIVQGGFTSRTHKEWTASDLTTGASNNDANTTDGVSRRYTGTAQATILSNSIQNMLCGKYVVAVRLKTSSNTYTGEVARMSYSDKNQSDNTQSKSRGFVSIKGTDFAAANEWQTFYMVFERENLDATKSGWLAIVRSTTTSSVNIDFDCAFITPVHPAVFDM